MIANRLFIVTVVSFLSITACKNSTYPHKLLQADSLAATRPDSAIVILEKMKKEMTSAPSETQMYYHLLCIKAHDKAYHPHKSDSLIREVLHYYIGKDNKRHLPEAYYYAGRVYRDLGDAPRALDYFSKSLSSISPGKDDKLKSRVYSQMGTLFLFQNLYDEALNKFKEAYRHDTLCKDSADLVYDLRDIAKIYRAQNKVDSSLYYFSKAYNLAYSLQDSSLINIVQSQRAGLYIELKKYDLAKNIISPLLNNDYCARSNGIYSIASQLYHQTGNIDSAVYYYEKILDSGTIYSKAKAHKGLIEIALLKENPTEALQHLALYIECNDSVFKLTDIEAVRKIQSLYNYQFQEKENSLLRADNNRKTLYIICLIALSAVVSAIIYAYLQYYRRKQLQLNIQLEDLKRLKEEQYRKSNDFIEKNKQKIEELEKQLQEASFVNSDLKEQLQEEQEKFKCINKQIEIERNEQQLRKLRFSETYIYCHVQSQIQLGKYKLTKEDWNVLEETVNDIYPDFIKKLNIGNVTTHELKICLLIKANVSPSNIAKIIVCTTSAISLTRRRLYKRYFQEEGNPKKWDEFIHSL